MRSRLMEIIRRRVAGTRAALSPDPRPSTEVSGSWVGGRGSGGRKHILLPRVPRPLSLPLVFFLLLGLALGAPAQQPAAPPARLRVTCTTTLLSAVVSAVGGDSVDAHTIVPFGMCPGHFDLTPGEADKLRNADVLLYHGFEQFLKGAEPGSKTEVVKAGVKGNWMIPTVHTQAVERVRAVLTEAMPTAGALFAERAEGYSRAVTQQAETSMKPLAAVRGTPVVCATMNRDLAEWLGCRVIAEFARDEDVSVKALHGILTEGKKSGAALVIDNMQSSGKIGRTIADELGIPFVMLSNFPESDSTDLGGYPYLETLKANIEAIAERLEGRGSRVEGKK